MTNQYMNNLYRDLLSNSPQTITIDIPADMGTGQILQVVTKQGAVVSDWKMNYFSDMNDNRKCNRFPGSIERYIPAGKAGTAETFFFFFSARQSIPAS